MTPKTALGFPLAFPDVHVNGTSRAELLTQLCELTAALEAAQKALQAAAPNHRDYYHLPPERWAAACEQFEARRLAILCVRGSVLDELAAIDEQD